MGLFINKGTNTVSNWVPVKKVFVNKGTNTVSNWVQVKKIFINKGTNLISAWTQFWPKLGPHTDLPPAITSDSAGTTFPTYVYVGTMPTPSAVANGTTNKYTAHTLYLQPGIWNPNGYSPNGISYSVDGYTTLAGTSGSINFTSGTLTLTSSSAIPGDYTAATTSMGLIGSYDGRYPVLTVTVSTTSSGVNGIDTSDSYNNGRIAVIKNTPTLITSTLSSSTGSPANAGSILSYSSTWQSADGYIPDPTRTFMAWYGSNVGTYTTLAQLQASATALGGSLASVSGAYNHTITTTEANSYTYIYGVESAYSGYTDYFGYTSGISNVKVMSVTKPLQPPNTPTFNSKSSTVNGVTIVFNQSVVDSTHDAPSVYYWAVSPSGPWTSIPATSASTYSFTYNTLASATPATYTFYIYASNYVSASSGGSSGQLTTTGTPTAVLPPSSFTISSVTKGLPLQLAPYTRNLQITWNRATQSQGAAFGYGYQVEGSSDNVSWAMLQTYAASPYIADTGAGTYTTTYTALQYTFYRVSVFASVDGTTPPSAGSTAASNNPFQVTGTAPSVPSITSVSPSYFTAALSWLAGGSSGSNSISGIQYSTDGGSTWSATTVSNPATISNLSPNTLYAFYIREVNGDQLVSGISSPYNAYTLPLAAPSTQLVAGSSNGSGHGQLVGSYSLPSGYTSYYPNVSLYYEIWRTGTPASGHSGVNGWGNPGTYVLYSSGTIPAVSSGVAVELYVPSPNGYYFMLAETLYNGVLQGATYSNNGAGNTSTGVVADWIYGSGTAIGLTLSPSINAGTITSSGFSGTVSWSNTDLTSYTVSLSTTFGAISPTSFTATAQTSASTPFTVSGAPSSTLVTVTASSGGVSGSASATTSGSVTPPPVTPPPVTPPPVTPPPVTPPPKLPPNLPVTPPPPVVPPVLPPPVAPPPKLPPNIPVTPPTVPALPTVPAVPTAIPQQKSTDWWKEQN